MKKSTRDIILKTAAEDLKKRHQKEVFQDQEQQKKHKKELIQKADQKIKINNKQNKSEEKNMTKDQDKKITKLHDGLDGTDKDLIANLTAENERLQEENVKLKDAKEKAETNNLIENIKKDHVDTEDGKTFNIKINLPIAIGVVGASTALLGLIKLIKHHRN